jgi:hypothetical protein
MESQTLEKFQEQARQNTQNAGRGRRNGKSHEPAQPEIPGTEHIPSAIELSIRPYAIKAAVARKRYQAAGREAKECVDQLKAVIEHQGVKGQILNCGGGVVVKPEIDDDPKLTIEIPDGMADWDEPEQDALDGTEEE